MKDGLMEFTIRQAQLSDMPYLYHVCVRTGNSGKDATELLSDEFIVGHYFAAPYLHFELETCFVLEYNNVPVGYILGASDTKIFNDWMNKNWLPQIRRYYPVDKKLKTDLEKFLFDIINTDCSFPDFLSDYPSHLHIDLLPVAQKKGFGKKMMATFIDRLKEKGSEGLHLSVGERNLNAIAFYKKLGFSELRRESGSVFMGMSLVLF